MKRIYSVLTALICLLAGSAVVAQPSVKQADIVLTNINLRVAQPVKFQSVIFTAHPAGTAVVRFDGTCYADSGDRMMMAASHDGLYTSNDGHVAIQVANASTQCRSFSHSRVYALAAGTDTFYAVGQNWVDQGGSGMASIYGSLTVEFFPATGPGVPSSNINWSGNLSGPQQRMDTILVPSAPLGKVLLHMDGQAYSDPGDRIVCTANDQPSWLVDAGSVAFMANSSAQHFSPFTHTRLRDITGNPNTFYAMGANVVDQGGSGNASIYGNLNAEFFPTAGGASVALNEISIQGLNVRGAPVRLDSITVTMPYHGTVLVQFDGYITSSVGDNIVLAASDTTRWYPNAGCVNVSALSLNNPFNVFSHSRLYTMAAGTHTFYPLAQNYVYTAGNGTINIDANFTVKYYPDLGVGINDVAIEKAFTMYPNPAQNMVYVSFTQTGSDRHQIEITDLSGRVQTSTDASGTEAAINVSGLAPGLYLLRSGSTVERLVKE